MSTLADQRVLVTGATGFIGRRLVHRLGEMGCRVSCLVRGSARGRAAEDELRSSGSHLLIGDVTDRESVDRALADSGAEAVFHLAGVLRAVRRGDFQRVNEGGAATVAEACARCQTPPTLLLVSSLAAAGPSASDRAVPRSERDPPAPVSWYGRSKLAGERAAQRWAGDMPITIVRPPIVFGHDDRAVLELFRPIARWGILPVFGPLFGDRAARVALVHVDDLVEGLSAAAQRGERALPPSRDDGEVRSLGKGIYFVAEEQQPTLSALGAMIATALGQPPPKCVRVPTVVMRLIGAGTDAFGLLSGRPGLLSRDKVSEALAGSWVCSPEKARRDLDWSPAASLADRLHETAQRYRDARWL